MRFSKLFLPAIVLLQLIACGGGGDTAAGPSPLARIEVTPAAATLTVGGSTQLTATLYDGTGKVITGLTVQWRSSDTGVASVDASGRVTALKAGPARIIAAVGAVEGGTDIAVSDPPPAAVDRVTVTSNGDTVEEGATKLYTATAYDAMDNVITGRGVHWSILDSSIATVDGGGEVTALRAGTTSVTARIDGKTASASVKVEAHYPFELMFGRYVPSTDPAVFVLDIRDPAAVPAPFSVAGQVPQQAVPSPDGLRVAFIVQNPSSTAIYVTDRDGSNAVALIDDGSFNEQPAWSPDGTLIAFRHRPPGSDADIWVMDSSDGSDARSLTEFHGATSQSSPAFSPVFPDLSVRIAYSHSENGAGQIWSMRADGTDHRPVTTNPVMFDDQPDWSPDGSLIVFQRSGDAIFGDLYAVDAAGGNGRLLMQLAGPLAGTQFAPAWSPDGQLVAFASRHAGNFHQIYTVWFDGTRLAQRTFDDADHGYPRWLMPGN